MSPPKRRFREIAGVALACWLASSGSGSGPVPRPPDPPVSTTVNFRVAASELEGEGAFWIVIVPEASQDARDLNGDGDVEDAVYHALDLGTRELRNLGLAAGDRPDAGGGLVPPPAISVEGGLAALFVDEELQGSSDLNGDGDAEDRVLWFYDFATGTLEPTELAVVAFGERGFAQRDGLAAFTVSEGDQGKTDIDGDGITSTWVLHVRTPDGELRNVREPALPTLAIADGHVGFMSPELASDRNGDGDRNDFSVFQVYDVARDTVVSSDLAVDLGVLFEVHGLWIVAVNEFDQGRTDLNGDGDTDDLVFHTFDPATGVARNLGRSSRRGAFSAVGEERVLLPVEERSMTADLNGDGDLDDVVVSLFDALTGRVHDTGLATRGTAFDQFLLECGIGIAVSEADQGAADRNGDGDASDLVLHTFEPLSGVVTNRGIDALELRGFGRTLLLLQSEAQAGLDLNGDGDLEDPVVSLWDSCTDALVLTGWTSSGTIDASGSWTLIETQEESEGRDLNGDGDADDAVLSFLDVDTFELQELGLSFLDARLVSRSEALILVDEAQEGRDLNQDGDQEDAVLHVVGLFD